MNKFLKILNKKERTVIGVLSGTSVDAVDVVLLKIKGEGINVKFRVLDYKEYKIPSDIKNYVLKVSNRNTGFVDDVCRLNFLLGKYYSVCINRFLKEIGLSNDKVDAIGSHGQTIHHLPEREKFGKIFFKSTLQIGDPSVIANNTGITTVGDFRTADVAVDGGGAPLVPYLDFVSFRSNNIDRILINIGGISNLTFLKKGCKFHDVIAFDTGPGNMIIDYLSKKFLNMEYDKNCKVSLKGKVDEKMFNDIISADSFIDKIPPKSTGREYYNKEFIERILKLNRKVSVENKLRTFTEYTAYSISENVKKYLKISSKLEILVSGGGAKNKVILNALKYYLSGSKIDVINQNGISTSNKEAVLFALLAHETLNLKSANLISVTGASKNVILGKISIA